MKNSSLFIFHKSLKISTFIKKLGHKRFFNIVILILIVLNYIEMCFDNNLINPKSKRKKVIKKLNIFFDIIFISEALLKITSNNLILQDPEDLDSKKI